MILKPTRVPVRVTRKSLQILNILASRDTFLQLSKEVNSIAIPSIAANNIAIPSNVAMKPLYFDTQTPGDVVSYVLRRTQGSTVQRLNQNYIVFPDQALSTHVIWVTEHNVYDMYEFTGEFIIATAIEQITVATYKEVVMHLEKLEVVRDVMITINTGWTLKSNQVILEEIGFARKAWILLEGSQELIEVIPMTDGIENTDTARGLYAYDVKFKINPTNALRNYTS